MTTPLDADQIERRAALGAKVAMLEERSLQGQKQMDRIEGLVSGLTDLLHEHTIREESWMEKIHDSSVSLRTDLVKQITEAVEPLKADIIKYKGIIGFVIALGSAIFTAISLFKEQIFKFFSH